MKFENQFDVDAPLDQVWKTVLDVERVAPTVPGAQVLERSGDDAYKVAIKVKVGPMSMTYRGEVEITERDEAAHRAVMKARAKESRGQGTADADVTMVLRGDNGRTAATVTTEVALTGKAATMGQGVLQDVAGRLVQTFAKNLATMLSGGQAETAAAPQGKPAQPGLEETPQEAPTATAKPKPPPRPKAGSGPAADAAAAPPPPPSPPPPPPPSEDALDLGSLGGAVLADRLRQPRTLAIVLALLALVFYVLGRRSARR
ncbi:MAG TPA: SRPBCC family protein [Solirubrobacteraceae bacterium]|nr:SRPBCC family protein [Solirubrobacteraceae bacterium]